MPSIEIIATVALVIMVTLILYSQIRNYSKLGKQLVAARRGMANVSPTTAVFFILSLSFFFSNIIVSGWKSLLSSSMLLLTVAVTLLSAMFAVQLLTKKGLFENGIQTSTMALSYSQIARYYVTEKNGAVRVTFNSNSRFFTGPFVIIDASQLKQLKAILKKNCNFKS